MKKKKSTTKRRKKEIEELRRIYWEIRNDPVAMRQARRLVATH